MAVTVRLRRLSSDILLLKGMEAKNVRMMLLGILTQMFLPFDPF